ncbi:MAG: hypothetical protein SOR90_00415, partial [Oscillospiraceae bacterium]|nr:hypothetical protein [Oscillospiraceae bacterium]
RVESSADDGRKGNSVISGDMRVGNDTSHDGQGDFSARIEPCPSCIPLSKKAKGLFRQAEQPPAMPGAVCVSFKECLPNVYQKNAGIPHFSGFASAVRPVCLPNVYHWNL